MRILILVFVALLILAPVIGLCSIPGLFINEKTAVEAMVGAGYSNVQVTGRWTILPALVGCEKQDIVKFDVRMVNAAGVPVKAYTCINMFTLTASSPHIYR